MGHIQGSSLTCSVSDSRAVPRFQAQRGGAAQHRRPLCLQHQADHRLWRLCGLHDPPGDPVQWVPRGRSWKLWACLRCLVSFSCECSKLHGKVRVPAKLCQRKQQRNNKSLSVWMTMGSRGHVSITHHSLVLYSHQQLKVTALAPHCPSSDKWDHLSLAVLTQTWFTGLSLDHARCHHIRFYNCPAANSHFAAVDLFHPMKQLRNYL